MRFEIDLIHYSLPYFSEGNDRELQFRPEDEPSIREIVDELIVLKQRHPDVFNQSLRSIKSIPDWLLKGPAMRVPCDAYEMIWVGADGTVQLCYVTSKLGNCTRRGSETWPITPNTVVRLAAFFRSTALIAIVIMAQGWISSCLRLPRRSAVWRSFPS